MRYAIGFLITLILVGSGCTSPSPATSIDSSSSGIPNVSSLAETVYTAFIINTHDWAFPEDSIVTISRIADLHEEYQLPVDIYLTDPMVQLYEKQAPELLEALKVNPYVAVSYHLRPPYPYYNDFHEEWFDGLDEQQLYDTLFDYESHAIDLTTGRPTEEDGGYQHLKNLMGYPPYVVVQASGQDRISRILARVYADMGAKMTLTHGRIITWGETSNGLFMRPEDLEIKVYENPERAMLAGEIMADALKSLPNRPAFLNLKWHENNFYSSGTSWSSVYYEDSNTRSQPLNPPFDLTQTQNQTKKSTKETREQWSRYEGLLMYVKTHPEFTAINARTLVTLAGLED